MIRVNDIKTNLLHLVGWQQNVDSLGVQVAAGLLVSKSGLYFQQVHPLVTIPNIASLAPKEICDDNTKFSTWLENKTADGVYKAISTLLNQKIVDTTTKSLLDNRILFDGAGRINNLVANTNSLVGFEIVPLRSIGSVLKINRIGFQFKNTGTIKLYLMHSSSEQPVSTITLTKTKSNTIEWYTPPTDLLLSYNNSALDAGGSWYLVYEQSALGSNQAIQKEKDWSKEPCSTCSSAEVSNYKALSQYVEVHPFKVGYESIISDVDSIMMWDVNDNVYTYETNYGLNLELSVLCDLTDVIISQQGLFANLIALQVACDMLREMAFNPNIRLNRTTHQLSKNDILYELDGDSTSLKKTGLAYKLDLAYKAVNLNLRGINSSCLRCGNNGIKYRSM